MVEAKIDIATFKKRVHLLQRRLASKDASFNGANAIVVVIGKNSDENPYLKSAVLHVSEGW